MTAEGHDLLAPRGERAPVLQPLHQLQPLQLREFCCDLPALRPEFVGIDGHQLIHQWTHDRRWRLLLPEHLPLATRLSPPPLVGHMRR